MPKTRRRCLEALAGGLVLAVNVACAVTPPPMPLHCTLTGPAHVAAGQPARFELQVKNNGARAVELLVWGTPFEPAWFAPYVSVQRGAIAVPYRGAKMKRGDPEAGHYLRFDAGQQRSASFELAPAFDVSVPGRYHLQPQIVLHDLVVGPAQVPRPRDQHESVALACNAVDFEVDR